MIILIYFILFRFSFNRYICFFVTVLVGYETNNKYIIKNNIGQKMFYAVEENDGCIRNCCWPGRPFDMRILDNLLNEIIHISRPLACQCCCFPCCLQVK